MYKRSYCNSIRITADFSLETIEDTRHSDDIFKMLKEKSVNQEFYIQPNYPPKNKKNFRPFQMNRN